MASAPRGVIITAARNAVIDFWRKNRPPVEYFWLHRCIVWNSRPFTAQSDQDWARNNLGHILAVVQLISVLVCLRISWTTTKICPKASALSQTDRVSEGWCWFASVLQFWEVRGESELSSPMRGRWGGRPRWWCRAARSSPAPGKSEFDDATVNIG